MTGMSAGRIEMRGRKGQRRKEQIRRRRKFDDEKAEFWSGVPYPDGTLRFPRGRPGMTENGDGLRSVRTGRLRRSLSQAQAYVWFLKFIAASPPGVYRWRPPAWCGTRLNSDPAGYGETMRLAAAAATGGAFSRATLAKKAGYDLRARADKNLFSHRLAQAVRRGWIIKQQNGALEASAPLRRYLWRVKAES